ncbi:MAG TPA: gluconeogenesis factor YvcK family protein [Acidimicrobiales bacterium]|nr:gluconeogenesis factor YvcK family protein [Acidimicrobiales bacterium]
MSGGDPLSHGGPRVVAIGGGHGLARTLLALRRFAGHITAVASVADDGGSSGRLREATGLPAPGDVRKCLAALSAPSSVLGAALEHRFSGGGLDGHAFGNLLLAALAASTGDFVRAVDEAGRLVGAVGRVLPATAVPVVLRAEAAGGELVGQVAIMGASGVRRVSLLPADAAVPAAVLEAIEAAEAIVIGPGSLFTSVLAALAPRETARALAQARARRVYVSNLREQCPETAGFDVARHVAALIDHGVVPDVVVADPSAIALGEVPPGIRVHAARLASGDGLAHDAGRLAAALEAAIA